MAVTRPTFFELVLLLAVFYSVGAAAVVGAQSTANIDLLRFDPTGRYEALGGKPRGFTDDSLFFRLFVTRLARRGSRIEVSGEGISQSGGLDDVELTSEKLAFTSNGGEEGVTFRFDGRWLKTGQIARRYQGKNVAVLEGVLTKFRNRRKVAEAKLRFRSMDYDD